MTKPRRPNPSSKTAPRDGVVTINWHIPYDGVAYIEWFHVPEGARGRGEGRRAYKKWERDLPPSVRIVRLHAADPGSGPSDGFWEAMGFDYRYDFAEEVSASSRDYEASKEMQRGVNGHATPATIDVEDD